MDKITIIGGGFSAFTAKLLANAPVMLITPLDQKILIKNMFRRKTFEFNKFFSKKTYSYGSLQTNLKNIKLHDRLGIGGNSSIWGGLTDIAKISTRNISKFESNGIRFVKLSFSNTGSISNNNLCQITNKDNVLDVKSKFSKFINGYLLSFSVEKKNIRLNFLTLSNKNKIIKKTIFTKKLIICTGVVQTIDLLYRSGIIKDEDIIKLDEFSYLLKYKFLFFPYLFEKSNTINIIRYKLSAAISHFLGIQKKIKYAFLIDLIPLYVDQYFLNKINSCYLKIDKGILKSDNRRVNNNQTFGNSIHYCNMTVNNININKLLRGISPNIFGLGMAFVSQKKPGPISNDIILDTSQKIK
ncbi:hypothetical protein MCEHALHM7_00878 [Methylophilaceae bacterium]